MVQVFVIVILDILMAAFIAFHGTTIPADFSRTANHNFSLFGIKLQASVITKEIAKMLYCVM